MTLNGEFFQLNGNTNFDSKLGDRSDLLGTCAIKDLVAGLVTPVKESEMVLELV